MNHKLYLSCHMPIISFPDEKIKIKTTKFKDNYFLKKQFKYVTNVKIYVICW